MKLGETIAPVTADVKEPLEALYSPLAEGGFLPCAWLEGGLAVLALDGIIQSINEPLANWLGLPAGGCLQHNLWTLLFDKFPENNHLLKRLAQSTLPFDQTKIFAATPGGRQWFVIELARAPSQTFLRLNSLLPPLSELEDSSWDAHLNSEPARRKMFVRLLRAESQLENLVRCWPGVIFSQRADYTFHFVSPHIEKLTGVPIKEWRLNSQRFWQVVHEADAEELQQQLKRAAEKSQAITSTYRIRNLQTGRVAYILEHRQSIVSDNGLLLVFEGVWLDITRQTIAERRLSTAAWKETLAVLTMGLAHDFSNVMSGILSLSESFLAQVDPQHTFYQGLTLIKRNALQASQLVHRIVHLHHGKTGERNYFDLNQIVEDVSELVGKIVPRRVRVCKELASVPLPLYVDAVEFRQVIINLSLNAAHAMPDGGTLLFQTSSHEQFPPLAHVQGILPRLPSVCLAVKDTGCGIKERHLASIFDPFFTTKAANKGSGLGLYNARLFVDNHQGAISVESKEGAGTTFCIWLPTADFTEAERSRAALQSAPRTLLLVGHAGPVLDTTAEFLRSHGYRIVVAASRDHALEFLEAPGYDFTGILLQLETKDPVLASLVTELHKQKLGLKTILQPVACNQDELPLDVLNASDGVIPPDLPEQAMLEKLDSFFRQPQNP